MLSPLKASRTLKVSCMVHMVTILQSCTAPGVTNNRDEAAEQSASDSRLAKC